MSIENGMSRRNFLSGAAVAGAAIAGMAGLSACSPSASSSKSDATADTKAAASGETTMGFDGTGAMPWLGEKPEIADADVKRPSTPTCRCGLGRRRRSRHSCRR